MKRFLCVLLFFALILGGCASPAHITRPTTTYETIAETLLQRTEAISELYAEGKITVETPSFAQTGSFVLFLQKPDSLYLTLQGPFGLKVGSVLLTRKEFFFYNSIENKLITGETTEENLAHLFRLPLTFDDVVGMITGGTLLAEDRHFPDELLTENEATVFVYNTEDGKRKYWIDPETTSLLRMQILDTDGNILIEQRFNNFRTVGTKRLPFVVQISQLQREQRLVLSYSTIKFQRPTDQKIFFSIPQNAEHIRW